MSRLAGVWYFDSRPVTQPPATLPIERPFVAPGLAMTVDAVGVDGSACAWDGRLDRDEAATPAHLALELYRTRGATGLRELVGDWSVAIWDAVGRSAVLASDFAGVRPLYYYCDAERLLWSSSLAALVEAAGADELDDRYVAAFLSLSDPEGRTPYKGIRATPPGCAVRVSAGEIRVERFWDVPLGPEVRLTGVGAYEERLRELFREAVAARVRSHQHVLAELSGGLDSSSIVCMAAQLKAPLTTISYTHPGATDEPYIRAVEQAYGISALHIDVAECPFVSPAHTGGAAPGWWESRYKLVARQMESIGATTLLTGQVGDLVMGNTLDDSDQVAGYLRQGRLREAGREAYAWSQSMRVPIYPILWRAARMSFTSWTPAPDADLSPTAWQRRAKEQSVSERLLKVAGQPGGGACELNWRAAPPDRRRRFRGLAGMLSSRRLQTPEGLEHVAYTHPFAHRPLIEFMLSIPPAEVCRPGQPRRLMRRALAGILPEMVLQRKSKAAFGGIYDQCLAPMAADMVAHPGLIQSVEMGYLDRASLLDRLDKFQRGLDCNLPQLRVVILFEFWLRSLRRGGAPSSGG